MASNSRQMPKDQTHQQVQLESTNTNRDVPDRHQMPAEGASAPFPGLNHDFISSISRQTQYNGADGNFHGNGYYAGNFTDNDRQRTNISDHGGDYAEHFDNSVAGDNNLPYQTLQIRHNDRARYAQRPRRQYLDEEEEENTPHLYGFNVSEAAQKTDRSAADHVRDIVSHSIPCENLQPCHDDRASHPPRPRQAYFEDEDTQMSDNDIQSRDYYQNILELPQNSGVAVNHHDQEQDHHNLRKGSRYFDAHPEANPYYVDNRFPRNSPKPCVDEHASACFERPSGFTVPFSESGPRLPSRHSGDPRAIRSYVNKVPEQVPTASIRTSHLLKRGLVRSEAPTMAKRGSGANDPENVRIVNLIENEGLSWHEVADILNADRIRMGRRPKLTPNGIHNRYNRNAPVLFAAEGAEFVPISARKKLRLSGPNHVASMWNEHYDEILIHAHNEVKGDFWPEVAMRFQRIGGFEITPAQAANRVNVL